MKAFPKSTTGITDERRQGTQDTWTKGKRELPIMQVVKQLNTGQSPKEIATPRPRFIGGARNDKNAWWWTNQAARKIWGRDPQEPVSSLILGMDRKTSPDLSYCLISAAGHGSPSLRGTIVPKQSRRGMRLPRPLAGARNDKNAWWWTNQAARKIWGRDPQEQVSSLILSMAGKTSPDLTYCPVYHTDEQDYYTCPWNTLCKEGDGRSWAINNTSNPYGVE